MATIIKKVASHNVKVIFKSIVCTGCTAYYNLFDSRDSKAINELPEEDKTAHYNEIKEFEKLLDTPCQCGKGKLVLEETSHMQFMNGYTIVECDCGREVECHNFTNTCYCGKEYNFNGSALAPREQWGYETGEVF